MRQIKIFSRAVTPSTCISGVGAIVQSLQYLSKEESLKAFVIWTMGSLGDVTLSQIYVLVPAVMIGLAVAVITIKPLNLLLFGGEYAVTMGLNTPEFPWTSVPVNYIACRNGNSLLRSHRLYRSRHATRHKDAL